MEDSVSHGVCKFTHVNNFADQEGCLIRRDRRWETPAESVFLRILAIIFSE